jgi:hypothetical protein
VTSIRRASRSEDRDARSAPAPIAITAPAITPARREPRSERNHSAGREVEIPNDAHLRFEPDAGAFGDDVLDLPDQRTTSVAVAPSPATMKFACLVETEAPPTRRPLAPDSSISLAA